MEVAQAWRRSTRKENLGDSIDLETAVGALS